MLVKDVRIDRTFERRQRMIRWHHRDQIDREQGAVLQERDIF